MAAPGGRAPKPEAMSQEGRDAEAARSELRRCQSELSVCQAIFEKHTKLLCSAKEALANPCYASRAQHAIVVSATQRLDLTRGKVALAQEKLAAAVARCSTFKQERSGKRPAEKPCADPRAPKKPRSPDSCHPGRCGASEAGARARADVIRNRARQVENAADVALAAMSARSARSAGEPRVAVPSASAAARAPFLARGLSPGGASGSPEKRVVTGPRDRLTQIFREAMAAKDEALERADEYIHALLALDSSKEVLRQRLAGDFHDIIAACDTANSAKQAAEEKRCAFRTALASSDAKAASCDAWLNAPTGL